MNTEAGSQAEKVGTAQSITTRFTFVGLADQVAIEERKDTAGAFKVTKSYAYGAAGENLSLVDTPINTITSKKSFYGTNPHSDVETLTDATGQTTSTYRYTAYGQTDKTGTTGEDAITGVPSLDADVVNPYRFNSKRFNGATGTYDMGFREYNPTLNRFLSRDMYDGALKDMALGSDPWTVNRYAFAGGNPVTGIELDGHCPMADDGGCDTNSGYTGPVQVPVDNGSTQPEAIQAPERSMSQKAAKWFGGNPTKAVGEELFIKPAVETYEACASAVQMQNYATNWQQCKTGVVLTGLGFTGGGKVFGIGVRTAEGLAAARLEAAGASLLTGRTANTAAQAAAVALRASGSIGAKRNIAAAEVRIAGSAPYLLRSVSGATERPGLVPGVGTSGNPQRFLPTATGNNNRFSDTEFKILNSIANRLGQSPSSVRGTINLHSELPVCSSCNSVISQFGNAFPNIVLNVTTG